MIFIIIIALNILCNRLNVFSFNLVITIMCYIIFKCLYSILGYFFLLDFYTIFNQFTKLCFFQQYLFFYLHFEMTILFLEYSNLFEWQFFVCVCRFYSICWSFSGYLLAFLYILYVVILKTIFMAKWILFHWTTERSSQYWPCPS